MSDIESIFGDISVEEFLKHYWQKKPLLIRNAIPDFLSPLTPEELAGLSCDAHVSSRLIIEKGGKRPWQVIYGPQEEKTFSELPATHWTLLVSDVEKVLPDLCDIVDRFRFIPDWRIDDLMISYAPEGGSVGPHIDQYDVFLLQAWGHRRWQINRQPPKPDNFVPGLELRIMKEFEAEQEWVVAPGDLLYLPPGIPHYGVALDDCMSYSIGFRAPTHADMVVDFVEHLAQRLPDELRYTDPNLEPQPNPGEISSSALKRVEALIEQHLQYDDDFLAQWFGAYITEPKAEIPPENEQPVDDFDTLDTMFEETGQIYRHPGSRFAYIPSDDDDSDLFVDGKCYRVSTWFAETLCADRCIDYDTLEPFDLDEDEQEILLRLYNKGKLYFDDEDRE